MYAFLVSPYVLHAPSVPILLDSFNLAILGEEVKSPSLCSSYHPGVLPSIFGLVIVLVTLSSDTVWFLPLGSQTNFHAHVNKWLESISV